MTAEGDACIRRSPADVDIDVDVDEDAVGQSDGG